MQVDLAAEQGDPKDDRIRATYVEHGAVGHPSAALSGACARTPRRPRTRSIHAERGTGLKHLTDSGKQLIWWPEKLFGKALVSHAECLTRDERSKLSGTALVVRATCVRISIMLKCARCGDERWFARTTISPFLANAHTAATVLASRVRI
jgi:hypothetical protein